jgi:hypothetical protein
MLPAGGLAHRARSTGCESDTLRTLDECPEHVLQEGSEMDADSRTSSAQVSPVQACTFSSKPSSPLRGGAVVCGRKPPLCRGSGALQVRLSAPPAF